MRVRKAGKDDVEAVAALLYESSPAIYDRFAGNRDRAMRILVEAFGEPGNVASEEVVRLAEADGRPVAAMAAFPIADGPARARAFTRLGLRRVPPWLWARTLRLYTAGTRAPREAPELATLEWSPSLHQWIEPVGTLVELVAPPFFNKAVHEAADGPGYYNAEVNVKGMVIFGYTWSVRQLNEGAGDYRLTFSFDGTCPLVAVNTFFQEGTTTILQSEEEVTILAEGDVGGTGVLDFDSNLTYIDVRILSQKGGGGNKGGKKN